MGVITDNMGNEVGTFEETLEGWRQVAEVEAGTRRELQAKLATCRNSAIEECARELDEMCVVATAIGTNYQYTTGLACAATVIRALKGKDA